MPRKQTTKKATTRKTTSRKTTAKKAATKKIIMKHPDDYANKIRQKAYENYLNNGGHHGDDMTDWLKAEKEIKEKYSVV